MAAPAPDPGTVVQDAVEAHLAACMAALEAEDEMRDDDDPDELPPSPAVAPFDGCPTCEVREMLAATWPLILLDAATTVRGHGQEAAAVILEGVAGRMSLPPFPPAESEGVHA